MDNEYLTIDETCRLLDISRPTLDSYRKKSGIESVKIKGRVFFKKLEILEKLYRPKAMVRPELDFTVVNDFSVEKIQVAPNVFDIRLLKSIDPFGAICLLCCLIGKTKREEHVYLLIGKDTASFYLQGINFFHELTRTSAQYVHYDTSIMEGVSLDNSEMIVPLHMIGYRGGEKSILDDIYESLKGPGFSEDLRSRLGWTLGELADNTATHAGGVPCYFMLSSTIAPASPKFLTLTIGDTGIGIPARIVSNEKYKGLKDYEAFLSAFKSNVSSWEDKHKRGTGLNDILAISKGNGAWIRAESNNMGVFFDFQADSYSICTKRAGTEQSGTRYCLVLIDSKFEHVTKKEINEMMDNHIGQL